MILIQTSEKALSFNGDSKTAIDLVDSLRHAYEGNQVEIPKMLNDFIFNIESALQDAKILDEFFEEIKK
jgi:hypothetical protein